MDIADDYSSVAYWDARYESDLTPFDWFQPYEALRVLFLRFLQKGDRILVLGCGTSLLSERLYDEGFTSITNVDFSETLLAHLRPLHAKRPGMTYVSCDITSSRFPFRDRTFDVIIDKATLDSVLCADGGSAKVRRCLREVFRCLRRGGRFVMVSFCREDERRPILSMADETLSEAVEEQRRKLEEKAVADEGEEEGEGEKAVGGGAASARLSSSSSSSPQKGISLVNDDADWSITVERVRKPSFVPLPENDRSHFVYICQKPFSKSRAN